MVDDIPAASGVCFYLGGCFGQRDQRVALAAGVGFVVGPRVDLRADALGEGGGVFWIIRRGRREGDVGEDGEGGDGPRRSDGYAVGAQAADRGGGEEGLRPGARG